jgi:hypothetical protein
MIKDIKVSISPDTLRAGGPVTLEATVVGDVEEVKRLVATVTEYYYSEDIPRVSGNVFRLSTTVPWEAPSGMHKIELVAKGDRWNTLYKTEVEVTVA